MGFLNRAGFIGVGYLSVTRGLGYGAFKPTPFAGRIDAITTMPSSEGPLTWMQLTAFDTVMPEEGEFQTMMPRVVFDSRLLPETNFVTVMPTALYETSMPDPKSEFSIMTSTSFDTILPNIEFNSELEQPEFETILESDTKSFDTKM